ncbi:MAG: hypothetical protein J2P43_12415 [Candidatus Dormibacteraeota bacterium]|nr:hypothetical protein [Candidatus Dormibacteraeota bacterium]
MRGTARGLAIAVGCLGVVQVSLGIAFWTGNADALIPIHMALGTALVLCLWALAGLGVAARIPAVLVLAGFVWGALTVIYGMTQELVLAGSLHWIAQVLHLTVGVVAVLIAVLIARSIQARRLTAATI